MVRKMLKAFTKVTADKTHLPIDIKNLTTLVYNQYSVTDSQEHSNISLTTSFLFKSLLPLSHQFTVLSITYEILTQFTYKTFVQLV